MGYKPEEEEGKGNQEAVENGGGPEVGGLDLFPVGLPEALHALPQLGLVQLREHLHALDIQAFNGLDLLQDLPKAFDGVVHFVLDLFNQYLEVLLLYQLHLLADLLVELIETLK